MPKELQLNILGEFRGLPQQVMSTDLERFGKLERNSKILHRFRIGDYRIYFERHELGVVVHRILSKNTLKDFLYRSSLPVKEDEALQQNPKFWDLIESAKSKPKPSGNSDTPRGHACLRTSLKGRCKRFGPCYRSSAERSPHNRAGLEKVPKIFLGKSLFKRR